MIQSSSRASFNTSNISQEYECFLKPIIKEDLDHAIESPKNGIHVEFKLSTQRDRRKQKTKLDEQNSTSEYFEYFLIQLEYFILLSVALFDVPKPMNYDNADMITLAQNKCKYLLVETKKKMFEYRLFLFLMF